MSPFKQLNLTQRIQSLTGKKCYDSKKMHIFTYYTYTKVLAIANDKISKRDRGCCLAFVFLYTVFFLVT